MRTMLLSLVLLAGPALAAQTVWEWQERGADGQVVTHYSDRPVPGARPKQLSTSNVSTSSSPTTYTPPPQRPNAAVQYQIQITSPADQESIVNTAGAVTVAVQLQPELQVGHSLQLYLDGRQVESAQSGNSFELQNVPRGTHTAVAAVISGSGSRVQESAPVTFFVRQESAATPPTGPALRPPPRPQPRAGNKMQTTQPAYAALNSSRTAVTVNPATNLPAVTRPATTKPATPAPRQGK